MGTTSLRPNIAHVYYLAGFIESCGRGIEKICDACKADHVPLPEYDITGNTVMIKFTAPEGRIVRGPNGTVNLTGDESRILKLLTENPSYTYQDIASRLGVGRKFVSVQITRLKEKGIIERIGSDKSGYWKITERKQ